VNLVGLVDLETWRLSQVVSVRSSEMLHVCPVDVHKGVLLYRNSLCCYLLLLAINCHGIWWALDEGLDLWPISNQIPTDMIMALGMLMEFGIVECFLGGGRLLVQKT